MAAGDIILDLEGVEGESKDSTYSGKIEIETYSWGLSNSAAGHAGGGAGVGRAAFSDLNLTAYTSKASTTLFINCAIGKHANKATLYVRKVGGDDKPKMYMKYTLTEPYITSFQHSHGAGASLAMESFALNFSKFEFEYFIQDEKGVTKSAGDQTFDIKANKKG